MITAALLALGALPAAAAPAPKRYRELGGAAALSPAAVIVLGARASEPERYAAERLNALLERRFGMRLAVVSEGGAGGPEQKILLGRASTHARLRRLARKAG